MPVGLKTVPVVLVLGELENDVRLPCHYCSEKAGISGRVWRRRSLHGKEREVALDMHDDASKNKVFVTEDHSLVIRQVQPKDAAYYFCYDVEDEEGMAKMDILLDVGYRVTLEPQELRMPADLDKEVPKWLKSCEKIRTIPAVSKYDCYAEWGPWSRCDSCGKIGERKRIGECRLQKFVKAQMKTPQGSAIEADFPVIGVGCHSFLLEDVPAAKAILEQIPNLVLIEKCQISCEGYVTKPSRLKAFQRSSFLKKIKMKVSKKLNEVSPTVKAETKVEKEGSRITLLCPGANIDTRVKWKFNERRLKPDELKEKSRGRVTIDATDALHIKELRVTDAGEYICTLYDVEIGIVRLRVTAQHRIFDPTTNFGVLTLTLMLSFILWAVLMAVRWKHFRMQRKAQKRNRRRQTFEESENATESSESQSLLSSISDITKESPSNQYSFDSTESVAL